jgi:hypothetical protein
MQGNLRLRRTTPAWILATMLFAAGSSASAGAIELRIGGESLDGENGFPFSTLPYAYGYANTRYQQVYSSTLFPKPFSIEEIAFFVSSNGSAQLLPATMEIYLSTTGLGVNEIDGRPFDDNLGAAGYFATLVGGISPLGTELSIRGQRFRYDPGQGNLLLDVRVFGAPFGHTGPFFRAFGPGDRAGSAPSVVSRWHDFGIGFDDSGLATAFRGSVPEPETVWLLLVGLAVGTLGIGLRTD